MKKFVVETVQVVRHRYYVEVEDPGWAHDGIVMGELDPFSSTFYTEDITSTTAVDEFPRGTYGESVNAATMRFNYQTEKWDSLVRWDLDPSIAVIKKENA
jgi:hypothetical protein